MKTEMKASNECLYPTDVFLISCGMGCKRITVSDIAYIEAMKDNCVIHMIDGKCYTQSCPMGDIEPELNPNMFKRIHRSFIVNIRYIDMYYYGHVVLENGMEVHIGDKYRDALKSSLAKTEHSHPLGMVVSTHFRCGKWVKRGLKNGALPFNID